MKIKLNQPYSFCQMGQRDNQEDSRYPNSNSPSDYGPFFIVCDGVGGNADGEVASRTVAETMGRALQKHNWSEPFTQQDFLQALDTTYQALDKAGRQGNSDMATTLAMVCFHSKGCSMVHLGDSRVYQYRPSSGRVYRSNDHSLLNELVHAGIVSPEQEDSHPQRSTISRYLAPYSDGEDRCQATWYETWDVEPGDVFFLCTDGVSGIVDDKPLEDILCSNATDEEKCRQIALMCHDSDDNNTAYLVSVANVEKDDDDTPDEEPADNGNPHATRRITRHAPVAVDLQASSNTGRGSRFLQYLKKTFKL